MMKPSPIALVVCDNIYKEPSGKTALVGLFNRINAPRVPATHPRMSIYAAVTDVHPGTQFRVRIEHAETNKVVAELEGPPPKEADRTTICDFMFMLQGLQFPERGRYYIQFWGDDHLLLQRPFEVEAPEARED